MTRADEGAASLEHEPDAKAILPEPRSVKKQFPISNLIDIRRSAPIEAAMRLAFLIMPLFAWPICTQSEVFIGPTSSTNRLVVNTNEAILVSVITATNAYEGFNARIAIGGANYPIGLSNELDFPAAFAGPIELILANQGIISYQSVQGAAIQSILVTSNSTTVITVPAGKSLRFFRPSGGRMNLEVTKGGKTAIGELMTGKEEFTGPVSLRPFHQSLSSFVSIVSYYYTDGFVVLPEQGLLRGPTGSFEITVEKSVDLTNWFPVVVHGTSADQKAFYRLKLQR